jgi:hypothetical protein
MKMGGDEMVYFFSVTLNMKRPKVLFFIAGVLLFQAHFIMKLRRGLESSSLLEKIRY